MKRLFLISGFLVLLSSLMMAQEAYLRPGFARQLVADGFTMGVGITFDEEGRGYIWDKGGRIYLLIDGEVEEELFLDIREEVANTGDNGMLGFVLDPDFQQNGYVYLFYTVDRHHLDHFGKPTYDPNKNRFWAATVARLTRFTADPATDLKTVIAGSRKVLFGETRSDGAPVMYVSHGAADVVFGEDGTLLIAVGDGAPWNGNSNGSGDPWYGWEAEGIVGGFYPEEQNVGAFRAQLLENAAGKVLRIDPETGEGVPGNPFFDPATPNSVKSKVWTLGLRNPFRVNLRPGTGVSDPAAGHPGTLYMGDVSGGYWEEVLIQQTGGANYGWPLYDDNDDKLSYQAIDTFNQYAPNPLADQTGCEDYFRFHDLIKPAGEAFLNPCDSTQLIPADIPTFELGIAGLKWYHNKNNRPARIEMRGTDENGWPVSVPVNDPSSGVTGDTTPTHGNAVVGGVFYDGTSFPEHYHGAYFLAEHLGWIKAFHFNLNDSLVHIDHFWQDTTKIVDLAVNPNDGCLYVLEYPDGLYRVCYDLNLPPVGVIASDKQYGAGPLEVQFSSEGSFDPDEDLFSLAWDFGDGGSSSEANPSHTYEVAGAGPQAFLVTLSLTDTAGNTSKEYLTVSVNNSPPQVRIVSPVDGTLLPQQGTTWVKLQAEVSDEESPASDLTYAWQEILHHNTHFHEEPRDTSKVSDLVLAELLCGSETYYYRIQLTVEDPHGLTATDQVYLFPDCVSPFLEVNELSVDGTLEQATLAWELSGVEGLSEIEVQWSPDNREFRSIATVSGVSRRFDHDSPLPGDNYYRLIFIDEEARAFYSQQVSISFLENWVQVYPNPVDEMVFVKADATTGEYLSITLYDLAGRVVKRESSESSGSQTMEVDLSGILEGSYFYSIEDGLHQRRGIIQIR